MSSELNSTQSSVGRFLTEPAVRSALASRRHRDGEDGPGGQPADTGRGSAAARPLRRWSVAELVARAMARPPTGGLAH